MEIEQNSSSSISEATTVETDNLAGLRKELDSVEFQQDFLLSKIEDEDGRPLQDVSADTLKLVLSEVLRDLRKAEKCYIKYELKQGCFHITTRGKG